MEVNISQAIRVFFNNSSFEMIFFEAFADALDAEATEFSIDIKLDNKDELCNLSLTITDNGVGFTEDRFSKFGKLLDVDEESHKGLGRLVYLCYFETIKIESHYNRTQKRSFVFSENFSGDSQVTDVEESPSGTTLQMSSFTGKKLARWDYVRPQVIIKQILDKFYLRLYKNKLKNNHISISVSSKVNQVCTAEKTLNTSELPELKRYKIDHRIHLFEPFELYYHIKKLEPSEMSQQRIVTAIGVDDRSQLVDIISEKAMPSLYDMVFLLISESFKGNVDESRQNLRIADTEFREIQNIFRRAIAEILHTEIPAIEKRNNQKKENLEQKYPHLSGYFVDDEIGYMDPVDVLKKAQDKFFQDQKEILNATNLTEEQYDKCMTLSSRSLAQYIIFRQNVIEKLKSLSKDNKERDLHNIISPQRCEFHYSEIMKDIYRNNVWVLDDKFMTYRTVLSEAEMTKVFEVLTDGEENEKDNDRPDITIFFSSNPINCNEKFDVVIVELKRIGLQADKNSIVEFQLDKRTQQLAKYYKNRIQRMWFYGIVDMDDDYRLHLENNQYVPLFSQGNIYYRSKTIKASLDSDIKVIQNSYIMDITALVEDANHRNSTFLKILQNTIKESSIQG